MLTPETVGFVPKPRIRYSMFEAGGVTVRVARVW
jgi:hypothetical protein